MRRRRSSVEFCAVFETVNRVGLRGTRGVLFIYSCCSAVSSTRWVRFPAGFC